MKKRIWSFIMAISMLLTSVPAVFAEAAWQVTDLKVNQMVTPMAVTGQDPTFSWRMESEKKGALQTAYQLQVMQGETVLWDTGKVESDAAKVSYAGNTLLSTTRYSWQVTVWNEAGETASASSWFETAFMDSAEFDASLISATKLQSYSGDYSVEYKIQVANHSGGFIFTGSDVKNNLSFNISTKSGSMTAALVATVNGGGAVVGSWDNLGYALTDEVQVCLTVRGTTATAYVNGKELGSYSNSLLVKFGVFGFRHYNSAGDQETAYYDDLIIKDANGGRLLSFDFSRQNPFKVGTLVDERLLVPPLSGNYSTSTFGELSATPSEGYTVETDFKVESNAFSLVFAGTDARNLLYWKIDITAGKGYLIPTSIVNGSSTTLAKIDVSAQIPSSAKNNWHRMKLDVSEKGEIKTYIDNVLVDTRTHTMATLSQIGFRQTKSGNEIAWIDNYKLTDSNGNVLITADFEDHLDPFGTGRTQNGALYLDKTCLFTRDAEQKGAPMFRTEFALSSEKTIAKARLYASSLGTYLAYINGREISSDKLAPGFTEYFDRIDYQVYDVTELLQSGNNAIGAVVGNGWYAGHVGEGDNNYQYYGIDVAFKGQLVVTYTDGTRQVIKTDDTWRYTTETPYRVTDHQNGETYDARYEQNGWNKTGFDDTDWHIANLATSESIRTNIDLKKVEWQAQSYEPVRVYDTITPKSVTKVGEDAYIFDMGQNFAGVVTLKATGVKGQTLRLRYGEMLYDENDGELEGQLYTANLRTAHATDYYTFGSNGTVEYTPYFTYHGFRYVEVCGLGYEPKAEDVIGQVWSNISAITSTLDTSSDLVDQIYSNALWSQLSNFVSIPTDCPQRDERLGWAGDLQVFAGAATMNADIDAFLTHFLDELFGEQGANGGIPVYAPNMTPELYTGKGGACYSDAATVIPWLLYTNYGDTEVIKTYYDNMKAWIGSRLNEKARYNETGNLIIQSDPYDDWLSVGEKTPLAVTSTAYFAYSTHLVAKMAAVIGETADAEYYEDLFCKIREQFKDKFVDENGRVTGDTQTAYILTLAFDLLDDPVLEQKAAARLAQKIRANGNKLTTGFQGTNFICSVLTQYGYADLAYALLLQTEYPSWGYSVVNGATTIWERWNAYTAGGGLGANSQLGSTMNSYNHYARGSIVEWIFEEGAGIQADPSDPGYHHLIMKPQINDALNHIDASYDGPYGKIRSNWVLDGNQYTWTVTVPANSFATVYVPGGVPNDMECVTAKGSESGCNVYEILSGTYVFTGTLPQEASLLADKVNEIDLTYYQDQFGNTDALVMAYQNAVEYLNGNAYADEQTLAHIAALEAALDNLTIKGADAEEGVVPLKDYAINPFSKTYQISTVSEWLYFVELVESGITFSGVTITLKNDLDFKELTMSGVGTYLADFSCAFKGTFEGNYHMLKNVNIISDAMGSGVFDATYGATIRRLGVSGKIVGSSVVGGIVGYADGGSLIEYCWNEALVTGVSTSDGVAGIAGNLRHTGIIRHCYNVGDIVAISGAAGICSWGQSGATAATVTDCYNMGALYTTTGVTMSIVHYGNTTSARTENCFYLDTCAGTSTQWAGTSSAPASAFTDGTVAKALGMEQGAAHPVFSVSAEEKTLAGLLENLGKYDVSLFVGGDNIQKVYDDATIAYQKGNDTYYGSYIETLSEFSKNLTLKNTYPNVPDIKDYDLYKNFGGKSWGVSDRAGMDLVRELGKQGVFGAHKVSDYHGYNIYLLNDIDMGGSTNPYLPIVYFKGNLDGKGHELKNFYMDVETNDPNVSTGIVNSLITDGVVQNIGIANGSIRLTNTGTSALNGGSIVGATWRGNIYNCWNHASVTGVQKSTGMVTMGGIVGSFGTNGTDSLQVVNCYNSGAVIATKAGGIAGSMSNNAKTFLLNCINTGTVTANTANALTNDLTQNITNCYYTSGTSNYGTKITAADVASGYAAYLLNKNGVAGNVAAAKWCMKEGTLALGEKVPVRLTYQVNGTTVATLYTDYEGKPVGEVAVPTPAEGKFFSGWQNEAKNYTADTVLTAKFGELTSLKGKTGLFVGDSICYGAYDDANNRRAWAGRLADNYGMITTNNGVSGSTISTKGINGPGQILSQLQSTSGTNFDYVILHGGVNDANGGVAVGVMSNSYDPLTFDTATYAGSLEQMIYYTIRTYGDASAIGYLFNFQVPNCPYTGGRDMTAYAAVAKNICEKWGIAFYDMYNDAALNEALKVTTSTYLPDNLHPNAAGYDILTPYIANFMQNIGPYDDSRYIQAIKEDVVEMDQSYFTKESYDAFQTAVTLADNQQALDAAIDLLVPVKGLPVSLVFDNICYRELKEFEVSSVEEFSALATAVAHQLISSDTVIRQTVNLDLKGNPNLRVGEFVAFEATYDGQNHSILNFTINDSANRTALFPTLSGTVKNLIVENAEVTANGWSAIVAANTLGTQSLIENVHVKNSTFHKAGTNNGIGLIVAQPRSNTDNFTVRNCTVSDSVINTNVNELRVNVGFIASKTMAAVCLIENCYTWNNTFNNKGSTYRSVGSIMGESLNCTIRGCGEYNNTFNGAFVNKGGILGVAITNSTTIEDCYSANTNIIAVASDFVEGGQYIEENCFTSCSVEMIESGLLAYRLKTNSEVRWVQTNMPMVSDQGSQAYMVTLNHSKGSDVYYTDLNGNLIADEATLLGLASLWTMGDQQIPGAALTKEVFTDDVVLTGSFLAGDLNGSGSVDVPDVILLLRYLLGYTEGVKGNPDYNGDGRTSIVDAVCLLRSLSN